MLDVLAIGLKLLAFLLKYGLSKCPNMGGGGVQLTKKNIKEIFGTYLVKYINYRSHCSWMAI